MANKALKGLTIKIGGDTTELTRSLDQVDKQSRGLSSELGQINKLLKLDPKNTELLAQKQKVLADAISNTEDKLDLLREAEKQAQEQFKKGEISEEQYRALQREIIATEGKLGKYKDAVKETADAEEKVAKGAEEAGKGIDTAGDKSNDAGLKFDTATVAAAALTAALVAAGEAAISAFNEVDKGADNVIKATGATGANAEKLVDVYKSVATQVVGSLDEIGATVGEVNTRFGYTGKELETVSTDFMKFAEVTGVNSTEAVKSVTRALNDSGIPLDEYGTLLDQLAKAGQSAGIDVTTLADGLSKNGATMRAMGFDTAESISLLAQFELAGADAATMLGGMKKAMATWAKEGQNSSQEFEKLIAGVQDGSVSAADALEVFGAKAGPQLVDAIKTGKFAYSDMLKVVKSSKGTMQATFEELEDEGYSVDRSFQRVKLVAGDMGEEIMENVAPALEDLVDYLAKSKIAEKFGSVLREDVVPAIKNISSWVKNNGPLIKSTLVGVGAAMVAFKVATVATTVAQNGLKGAIMATTVAQKALALAQAATPWGLVATAVAGVTTAVVALAISMENAKQPADILTEEERELMAAADEAAESFREQKAATEEALGDVTAEMQHTQDLADELRRLADASGEVKETDKERAQFILNELNEALGTEYTMTGNVIDKYKDLKKNIDEVIKSKSASMMLEAASADYTTAIQEKDEAYQNMVLSEKDYQNQLDITNQKEKAYTDALVTYQDALADAQESGDYRSMSSMATWLAGFERAYKTEKDILDKKKGDYDAAASNYEGYIRTINTYEESQEAFLSGNYETVLDLLSKKGEAHAAYADEVDEETARVLTALEQEAVDAGIKAKQTKENFENGVEGYTKKMVDEAEKGYSDALKKFSSAYSDAHGIGESFGRGLANGIIALNGEVGAAAIAQIREAVKAAKKEAEIKSPSRVARKEIGAQLGEGNALGIQDKTKDVKRAASDQMSEVLDTYRSQEVKAQKTFRNVADQQAARQMTAQMTAASANSTMLEEILTAIKKGQVLTIDGETLVGATANAMDNALGRRRALAARGAL